MDFLKHSARPLFTSQAGPEGECLVRSIGQAWTQPTFWILFLVIGTPYTLLSFSTIVRADEPRHVAAAIAYFLFAGAMPVVWGLTFLLRSRSRRHREGRSELRYVAPEKFRAGEFRAVLEIPKALPSWTKATALVVATPPLDASRESKLEALEPGEEYTPEWAEIFEIPDHAVRIESGKTSVDLRLPLPVAVEEIPPAHQFRVQVKSSVKRLAFDATFEMPNRSQAERAKTL